MKNQIITSQILFPPQDQPEHIHVLQLQETDRLAQQHDHLLQELKTTLEHILVRIPEPIIQEGPIQDLPLEIKTQEELIPAPHQEAVTQAEHIHVLLQEAVIQAERIHALHLEAVIHEVHIHVLPQEAVAQVDHTHVHPLEVVHPVVQPAVQEPAVAHLQEVAVAPHHQEDNNIST